MLIDRGGGRQLSHIPFRDQIGCRCVRGGWQHAPDISKGRYSSGSRSVLEAICQSIREACFLHTVLWPNQEGQKDLDCFPNRSFPDALFLNPSEE